MIVDASVPRHRVHNHIETSSAPELASSSSFYLLGQIAAKAIATRLVRTMAGSWGIGVTER
jgi:hypothetical protein